MGPEGRGGASSRVGPFIKKRRKAADINPHLCALMLIGTLLLPPYGGGPGWGLRAVFFTSGNPYPGGLLRSQRMLVCADSRESRDQQAHPGAILNQQENR